MGDKELKFKKRLFITPVEAPTTSCQDDCCNVSEDAAETMGLTEDSGKGILSEYRIQRYGLSGLRIDDRKSFETALASEKRPRQFLDGENDDRT